MKYLFYTHYIAQYCKGKDRLLQVLVSVGVFLLAAVIGIFGIINLIKGVHLTGFDFLYNLLIFYFLGNIFYNAVAEYEPHNSERKIKNKISGQREAVNSGKRINILTRVNYNTAIRSSPKTTENKNEIKSNPAAEENKDSGNAEHGTIETEPDEARKALFERIRKINLD